MTVYMTSSADHDQAAAFSVPGGRNDDMSKRSGEEEPLVRSEPAQAKKKVMYFAAGSGIPEVKVCECVVEIRRAFVLIATGFDL